MKRFEKQTIDTRDNLPMEVAATICRILLTPIMVWYRLYLWVWDGTIFNKHY